MTDPASADALRAEIIEAMSWSETFAEGRIGYARAEQLLDRYLAAQRPDL